MNEYDRNIVSLLSKLFNYVGKRVTSASPISSPLESAAPLWTSLPPSLSTRSPPMCQPQTVNNCLEEAPVLSPTSTSTQASSGCEKFGQSSFICGFVYGFLISDCHLVVSPLAVAGGRLPGIPANQTAEGKSQPQQRTKIRPLELPGSGGAPSSAAGFAVQLRGAFVQNSLSYPEVR